MSETNNSRRTVKILNAEVARKIAAGEVIDRPNAIVRELMDNAIDSGADHIAVEITSGGIEKIRVIDNGCGMSEDDLRMCAHPHATSKIETETDLLNLSTLGFRGEALSSMAAVSRLEIKSGSLVMNASVTEDHIIKPCTPINGTIVQTSGLFENFPARRQFLKRPASEALLCRSTFEEKVLPWKDIEFSLSIDGEEKLNLAKCPTLKERFVQALELFESADLFYEISGKAADKSFSFTLVIGEPSVSRSNRKNIYIYVNGRRITEYSLVQAIEYGAQGFFPNGLHPVACLFVEMDSSLVDFNIHPAKREARFKDPSILHHAVSTSTRDFFKQYTKQTMTEDSSQNDNSSLFDFTESLDDKPLNVASRTFPSFNHTNSSSYKSSGSSSYSHGNYQTSSYPQSNTYRIANNKTSFEYSERLAKMAAEMGSEQDQYLERNKESKNYLPSDYKNDEDDFHFVGSTLGTFLIAEKNDTLYIIDQHAAHERSIYDTIMKTTTEKQALLVPYVIQTDSKADDAYLTQIQAQLNEAGYEGKNCGNGKWEFTTVPARWKGTEEDLKNDLLDRRIQPFDIINAVAASTACRMAVKAGDILDQDTAANIARIALELPDPHCPHGRPVFTSITRKQLYQLVKRI
ncbi:MAG: DNA mismatch repair endonuclease MutL [Treponema sp.]|nr:DNA mismatch repair endonuclease MutL [Treponema sp.]